MDISRQNNHLVLRLCLLLTVMSLCACDQSPKYTTLEGQTMGTSYHITYQNNSQADKQDIQSSIDKRLKTINDSMSTYQQNSLISVFNQLPADKPLTVDQDFINVFKLSKQVYTQSNGAFDPTVMPLVKTWGFAGNMTVERLQNPPSQQDINNAKALIDFNGITLQGNQLSKQKTGIGLDFSAIAKGYGVDVIADVLKNEYQINNYMIEIGGEVATKGVNAQQRPWQIAVDTPIVGSNVSNRKTLTVLRQPNGNSGNTFLPINQMFLATSGNYRNSVVFNGVRYSHTIDPLLGAPVQNGAPSVSVLATSTALADAWATALTAMPYEKALITANNNDIAALFVLPKDNDLVSVPTDHREWQTIESAAMKAVHAP